MAEKNKKEKDNVKDTIKKNSKKIDKQKSEPAGEAQSSIGKYMNK